MQSDDISKALKTLEMPAVTSTLNRFSPDIVRELRERGQELLNDSKFAPNRPQIINSGNNFNNQQLSIADDKASSLQERLSKI